RDPLQSCEQPGFGVERSTQQDRVRSGSSQLALHSVERVAPQYLEIQRAAGVRIAFAGHAAF
ncbi:MAG: hypothetical protein ACE5GA_10645, partial [Candidatus Zixiibacteriota bacterium]